MDLQSFWAEISEKGLVRVASISEAVELATHFKQTGRYDLFRGQRKADWRLSSSAERKGTDEAAIDEVGSAFARLYAFASHKSEMTSYRSDRNALWAIAQHYGLPTQYIDFTRNPAVAAFFASDSNDPPEEGQEAAIFCLNSSEFTSFWKDGAGAEIVRHHNGPNAEAPEVIDIDVRNLWRLESQEGCFLWMPIPEFERHWSVGKIVFPYTKDHSCLPRREFIYPLNQSALEKLLTQFFMNDRMRDGTNNARKEIGGNVIWNTLAVSQGYYDGSEWLDAPNLLGQVWGADESWRDEKTEQFCDVSPGWVVRPDGEAVDAVAKSVVAQFQCIEFEEMRGRGIEFEPIASVSVDAQRFLAATRRLWNGMRRLPYTREEVLKSLVVLAKLFDSEYFKDRNSGKPPNSLRPFDDEEAFYVEFGPTMDGKGAYSRAHVGRTALATAFSEAFICEALKHVPSWKDPSNHPDFIQLPCRPWHRFTYEGLKSLMVNQLIPSQLVLRGAVEGEEALRVWIAFSPAELKTFGLA